MKKLIYFYCEDLRGFEDTEFNFSSKYKIHFDKDTKTLTIDKGDENYIDNFYGDNIELNAIVGNNGAGKSTLLKRLYPLTEMKSLDILVFETIEYELLSFDIYYCYNGYFVETNKKDVIFPLEIEIQVAWIVTNWLNEMEEYCRFINSVRLIYIIKILY